MARIKQLNILLILTLCIGALVGCTWLKNDDDANNPYAGWSEKKLYTEARHSLITEQYVSAIKRFEAMESMYPFSGYAARSQLGLMYAYYKNEDYPSAGAAAERFMRLYPRSKHVDYAYYMKGLANFQQPRAIFSNVIPFDESWRDTGTQATAYADFASLIDKFPNSYYKTDALQRMIYLRNMFAKRELNTANYYYERKMYVAAAERANDLIKNYPQAESVEQALIILYHAKQKLGLHQAAADIRVLYAASYPDHKMPLQP